MKLPTSANDKIRFFTVAKATSEYPQEYADANGYHAMKNRCAGSAPWLISLEKNCRKI
ncbi:MAG: hypothetical protein WDN26_02295 [Chitinophagaceae bacterium]